MRWGTFGLHELLGPLGMDGFLRFYMENRRLEVSPRAPKRSLASLPRVPWGSQGVLLRGQAFCSLAHVGALFAPKKNSLLIIPRVQGIGYFIPVALIYISFTVFVMMTSNVKCD